ncbi:MAG: hypothetical protein J7647_17735 [Cyanobacteria bacterium SBLK]|nr:hypothetical protein [Cyanobacteria bacterium SBLK]
MTGTGKEVLVKTAERWQRLQQLEELFELLKSEAALPEKVQTAIAKIDTETTKIAS